MDSAGRPRFLLTERGSLLLELALSTLIVAVAVLPVSWAVVRSLERRRGEARRIGLRVEVEGWSRRAIWRGAVLEVLGTEVRSGDAWEVTTPEGTTLRVEWRRKGEVDWIIWSCRDTGIEATIHTPRARGG